MDKAEVASKVSKDGFSASISLGHQDLDIPKTIFKRATGLRVGVPVRIFPLHVKQSCQNMLQNAEDRFAEHSLPMPFGRFMTSQSLARWRIVQQETDEKLAKMFLDLTISRSELARMLHIFNDEAVMSAWTILHNDDRDPPLSFKLDFCRRTAANFIENKMFIDKIKIRVSLKPDPLSWSGMAPDDFLATVASVEADTWRHLAKRSLSLLRKPGGEMKALSRRRLARKLLILSSLDVTNSNTLELLISKIMHELGKVDADWDNVGGAIEGIITWCDKISSVDGFVEEYN